MLSSWKLQNFYALHHHICEKYIQIHEKFHFIFLRNEFGISDLINENEFLLSGAMLSSVLLNKALFLKF